MPQKKRATKSVKIESVQVEDMEYELNVLYPDVPFDTYCQAPGINASGLKEIMRSPAHFRALKEEPERETPALELGKLIHLAVLEPERFLDNKRVRPKFDGRTKEGKAGKAEFEASLGPTDIVVPDEWEEILLRLTDQVKKHPTISALLKQGTREGTFWWIDQRTGLLCKARPDFASHRKILVDLKSTEDARAEDFSKSIYRYRYDVQTAHYCAGASQIGIARPDAYAFIVVEKSPPYELCLYTADASVFAHGTEFRQEAMARYAECLRTDTWPGYDRYAKPIGMPAWAKGVPQ